MQTFLPYSDLHLTAEVLDRQRLGKQRVETLQIMTALLEGRGWINHPATKMWRGYEAYLLMYQEAICNEWVYRGYRDTCFEKTERLFWEHNDVFFAVLPPWLGDMEFHRAHQSNLLRKLPEWYEPIFGNVPDNLPYVWPV